jgi:UDP-glucose 4-epimerase
MRCLVLGGTGFIGSHIVEVLEKTGHSVRLLARKPRRDWSPPARVDCNWTDWNNAQQLDRAVADSEVVIHLIGTTRPATSNINMVADVQENLASTLQLLELCRRQGVRKVIFASTGGAIYGIPQYLPINEEHPTQPTSSYGIVKLAIEKYLHLFHYLHGLGYIILRGSNPYGERQDLTGVQGVVGVSLGRIARGEPIELWGNGQVIRDYLYVGDLARAFQLAVESDLDHHVFNVGSGHGLSLRELIDEMQIVTGLAPKIVHQPGRPVDVPVNVLDSQRIASELSWRPTVALRDGLKQTWDWVQCQVEQAELIAL